jgi:uncharacterized membrane protein YjfL (UPF0719 family)
MANAFWATFLLSAGEFLFVLAISIVSLRLGWLVFRRLSPGIDWAHEAKKGNGAVPILLAACLLSFCLVVAAGLAGFSGQLIMKSGIFSSREFLLAGGLQILGTLLAAGFSSYISIRAIDILTSEIDEVKELSRGNVAVALLMAGVLLAVSFVVSAGVFGISLAIGAALL